MAGSEATFTWGSLPAPPPGCFCERVRKRLISLEMTENFSAKERKRRAKSAARAPDRGGRIVRLERSGPSSRCSFGTTILVGYSQGLPLPVLVSADSGGVTERVLEVKITKGLRENDCG